MGFSLRSLVATAAPIAGSLLGGPIGGAIGGAIGARASGGNVLAGALMGGLAAPAVQGIGAAVSGAFTGAGGGVAGVGAGVRAGGMSIANLAFGGASAPPSGGAPGDTVTPAMGSNLVPVSTGAAFPGGAVMDGFAGGMMPVAAGGLVGRAAGGAIGGAVRVFGNLVFAASGRIRGLITSAGQFVSARRVMSGAKVLGLTAASAALGVGLDQLATIVLQESTRKRGRGRGISARDFRTTKRTTRKIIGLARDLRELSVMGRFGRARRTHQHAAHGLVH